MVLNSLIMHDDLWQHRILILAIKMMIKTAIKEALEKMSTPN